MKYGDENRGVIQYPELKRILTNFSKLRYGYITPTDIDAFIEMHDELYIFYEFKYSKTEIDENIMPNGQKKALMRLADALQSAGKESVVILCRHEVENTDEQIQCGDCSVDRFYYKGTWFSGNNRNAKQITDDFISYLNKDGIN